MALNIPRVDQCFFIISLILQLALLKVAMNTSGVFAVMLAEMGDKRNL